METNAVDSIPVDGIRTACKIYRFHVRTLDFIRQNANRIRQSYCVDGPLKTLNRYCLFYLIREKLENTAGEGEGVISAESECSNDNFAKIVKYF